MHEEMQGFTLVNCLSSKRKIFQRLPSHPSGGRMLANDFFNRNRDQFWLAAKSVPLVRMIDKQRDRVSKLGPGRIDPAENGDQDQVDERLFINVGEVIGPRNNPGYKFVPVPVTDPRPHSSFNQTSRQRFQSVAGRVEGGLMHSAIHPHGKTERRSVLSDPAPVGRIDSQEPAYRHGCKGIGKVCHEFAPAISKKSGNEAIGDGLEFRRQRSDKIWRKGRARQLSNCLMFGAFLADDAPFPEISKTSLQTVGVRPRMATLPDPPVSQEFSGLPMTKNGKPIGCASAPVGFPRVVDGC